MNAQFFINEIGCNFNLHICNALINSLLSAYVLRVR